MGNRIKICGMTRPEDAVLAAELGADAIGLNFVGGPRRIGIEQSQRICVAVRAESTPQPNRVEVIALCTMDRQSSPNGLVWNEIPIQPAYYAPDAYQVYGPRVERIDAATILPNHWWMVARIENRGSILEIAGAIHVMHHPPAAIVMDTASKDALGGTGHSFDWNWIAEARAAGELIGLPPIILAGGLNPDNVAEAIRIARPYAVDVSSGVEVAGKPGIKDPIKMRDFVQAVRGADGIAQQSITPNHGT